MRKKLLRVLASLAMVAGLLAAAPAPALGASYGACIDGDNWELKSGEYSNDTSITGIAAQLNPSHLFHMCTPPETSWLDTNASIMQINLTETDGGPGFITAGVAMCDQGGVNPADFCYGYPGTMRFYSEWLNCSGNVLAGFGQDDLGPADFEAHSFVIAHNGNQWDITIDGYWKQSYHDNILSCLDPDTGQQVKGQWMVETVDRADGLGTSAYVSRIKNPQIRNGFITWSFETFGTCDHTSSQHVATCSGSGSTSKLDVYTNN